MTECLLKNRKTVAAKLEKLLEDQLQAALQTAVRVHRPDDRR